MPQVGLASSGGSISMSTIRRGTASGKNVGIDPGTAALLNDRHDEQGVWRRRGASDVFRRSRTAMPPGLFRRLSSDLATQFGENTEFFVQWRQRFNQAFVDTYFKATDGSGQGGIKLSNDYDRRSGRAPVLVCTALETVVQTLLSEAPGVGFATQLHGQRLMGRMQHLRNRALPIPFSGCKTAAPIACIRNEASGTGTTAGPNCFAWVSNEWSVTFQMGHHTGRA